MSEQRLMTTTGGRVKGGRGEGEGRREKRRGDDDDPSSYRHFSSIHHPQIQRQSQRQCLRPNANALHHF